MQEQFHATGILNSNTSLAFNTCPYLPAQQCHTAIFLSGHHVHNIYDDSSDSDESDESDDTDDSDGSDDSDDFDD